MKLIPLTKGYFAKVDDEDFERLMEFSWSVLLCSHGTEVKYARRTAKRNGRNVTLLMHRQLLEFPNSKIDHADGDGLNNQRNNIRVATSIQNGGNRRIQKHSAPYKGVCLYRDGRYHAAISINKKVKHLGYFDTAEEAALVYDYNATLHYGEFARTNRQMGVI